jgi:hypothetical protein
VARLLIRLAPFFEAGSFYGLDELTHVHVHPAKPAEVVNCFNLEDYAIEREVEFVPEKFSLDAKLSYQIKGVRAARRLTTPSRRKSRITSHSLLLF